MTHDERLVPARDGRDLDRSLADLTQTKGYGRYGNNPSEVNLKEYLFVVLKRKWLIMSIVLVITSLATIQAYREPSIYEGATTIKIEQKAQSILQSGTGGIVIGQNDPNFWGTQLKLLNNPALARQVVITLDLQHNPNFFGPQGQSTIFASLKRIFSRDASAPAKEPAVPAATVDEESLSERQFTAEQLAALEPYEDTIVGNEIVEPVPQTNLVIIRYRHTDPVLAQKIADTLAKVFIDNNVVRQESGTSKAAQDLAQEIAKYQEQIKKKQADVFNYAKTYELPLTDAPASNLRQQRVATYSSQLLEAENNKRQLQAAYEAAKNSPDPFSNPEVQKDARIINLRQKISELKDKESGLLQKYTKEWPEVQQVEAQIKSLEDELKKAPAEVLSSMKAKADAASTQLSGLQAAYSKESGLTAQQTKNIIELASMRADLASDQQYLNTVLQKRRELNAVSGTGGTNVSVSNNSRLPHAPIGPQRMRTILIAFMLSLVAGIGLAFLLDFLDDSIRSVDDISRYINLPSLALIPAAGSDKPRLRGGAPAAATDTTALAMVKDVRSPIAESYRHLRTSLLLSSAGTPPRTILVTSSQPSEGKTTTAINTAFILAQTGAEVLIIDCDLRRPRLHAHFNLPNVRGLTNALSGDTAEIESLLQTCEPSPNLKVLTSGPMPPNPAELLGSEEMRKLLKSLSERFTHVIVDSPPAISFTDASILSTFVDGVILVVHGGRSSRAVVRRAKQQLMDIGANIFGVVLNNVKMQSKGNYYYSGYYSGYYDYYGSEEETPAEESSRAASG